MRKNLNDFVKPLTKLFSKDDNPDSPAKVQEDTAVTAPQQNNQTAAPKASDETLKSKTFSPVRIVNSDTWEYHNLRRNRNQRLYRQPRKCFG